VELAIFRDKLLVAARALYTFEPFSLLELGAGAVVLFENGSSKENGQIVIKNGKYLIQV